MARFAVENFWTCLVLVLNMVLPAISNQVPIPVGGYLDLQCTDNMARDLVITETHNLNGSEALNHLQRDVNATTTKLHMKMDVKGVYSFVCLDRGNRKRKITKMWRVIVDEPPHDVTNFKCKSYDLEQLICTWSYTSTFVITNFALQFLFNGQRMEPCRTTQYRTSCTWTVTTVPRYRQLEEQFNLVLTSINVFGRREQNFTIDHYSIVQPAPVYGLKVLETGAYSALLYWTISKNMLDLMPIGVDHKIEYLIENKENMTYHRVDVSSLAPTPIAYRFRIGLPYAHTKYRVRVSIRPRKATEEEYWSEPSEVTFYTSGKSTSEIARTIYDHWRKKPVGVGPAFSEKLRKMKSQKRLYESLQAENSAVELLRLQLSTSKLNATDGVHGMQEIFYSM